MKSTVENLGPTRIKLAVELPFAELQPSIDAALKRVGAEIRIPGFRPGKAPARVIEQRVGRAAVLNEAVNDALPRVYSDAVSEAGVTPVGQPDIEVTDLDDGNSLSFTAEVDVRPEVELPDYKGIVVEVEDTEVNEAQVDEQLDALRDRFGTLKAVDRPVQTGDYVSIDLTATVDGAQVEGGTTSGMSYQVGSGDLIEGIDEIVVGADAGDVKTFASTLNAGEFAGRDAEITVTVNSVKEKELPDPDDDFAQLASEFDTLDELRADLRERIGRVGVMSQGAQARDRLVEQLLESVELPLPESAVKAEIEWRKHDIVHQLEHDDARFEQFLAQEGKTREEFEAELREIAERSVKSQFILDAIADAEQVNVGDAELTEYLVRQAQQYGIPAQEFANQLLQAGNLPSVIADVRRNKALATVLEAATITDASGRPVDLTLLTRNPTAISEVGAELDEDTGGEDTGGEDTGGEDTGGEDSDRG